MPKVHESPTHAIRTADGGFAEESSVLRYPCEFSEIVQVGLARNSTGKAGTKRRSSAVRSASVCAGLKMST